MNQSQDIWVLAEINQNKIEPSTFELIAKAQEIKKENTKVTAILLTDDKKDFDKILIGYGADKVIYIENDLLKTFNPVLYKDAFVALDKKYQPSIVLLAATFKGRSLAPRIQGALQTGLTADCLDLSINDKGQLIQIKPSYGDNLMCTILIPDKRPQMTTVRPSVFKPLEFDTTRQGEIIKEVLTLKEQFPYEVIQTEQIDVSANSITDANRVIGMGRGMKSKENTKVLEDIAKLIDAKVGVTRPLAENGWYTIEGQIGQSGVTIQPELLLNFGVSGAVQYTVGMTQSQTVFSVNKDPDASIFKESDYGYIGDAKAFADALYKILK